jgi:hypothetical protein
MVGFSFNKALGAGVSAGLLGTFLPALLGLLHWVQPVAGAVNPVLGALVGLGALVLTWLTPKNAPAKPASS